MRIHYHVENDFMVAVSRNDSEIVNLDDAREGGYDSLMRVSPR